MNAKAKKLIDQATEIFTDITGLKVTHKATHPVEKIHYPDGVILIDRTDNQWIFTVQAQNKITSTTVALEKATQSNLTRIDRIIITTYVTPPMADRMRQLGLFFMDTAGNAYIDKAPLYVFIKGNKPPEMATTTPTKRLFKPAGLKVVFALLNKPNIVNWPYRKIAAMTNVALGTVEWVFRDLKAMGFLFEVSKRKRKLANLNVLMRRWVEAYPDQLRPKLITSRFEADNPEWWKTVDLMAYNMCWGGEIAAAKLTEHLKPQKAIIYGDELPGRLIIKNKLRKADNGNVQILKPFWNFDHALKGQSVAPPLLIYADLMATGDVRNIETAGLIHDNYLVQFDRQY